MGTEIERRFLVLTDHLDSSSLTEGVTIEQGYLSAYDTTGEAAVTRVRVSADEAWLTVKGRGLLSRPEFEYEIPHADGVELLNISNAWISKIRYKVTFSEPSNGPPGRFVVDEFLGSLEGLWLAEIELQQEDEWFPKPPWLGREVTHDHRYANVNLANGVGIPKERPQSSPSV